MLSISLVLFHCILLTAPICNAKNLSSMSFCIDTQSSYAPMKLKYPDGSLHPVLIPFASWESAQIVSNIAYLLITEAMEYSAILVDGITWSPQAVNLVAGCFTTDNCSKFDITNPGLHFTVESWSGGILQVQALPSNLRPVIASVLNYNTYDGPFVWQKVVDAGMQGKEHLPMNYYTSYNANYHKPFLYFDPWNKLLEVISEEIIVRCSDMLDPGSSFYPAIQNYLKHTTDSNISCYYNDSLWFSPACRRNLTECVPTLIQYDNINMMQQAYWLDLPIALLRAQSGTPAIDGAYYAAIAQGTFLFGWYTPDDSLVDPQGNLPAPLVLPPTDQARRRPPPAAAPTHPPCSASGAPPSHPNSPPHAPPPPSARRSSRPSAGGV